MLNDRERRTLARIEQELAASDPDFVRLFARAPVRTPRISGPAVLLAVGLVVMVIGSALVSVAVAMLGMLVAGVALVAAHRRPIGFGTT